MLVGLTLKQWRSLCAATGLTEAVAQLGARLGSDLDQEGERFRARRELAALVAPWLAQRTLAQVAAVFDAHGVCWGRYQTLGQLVNSDPSCSTSNAMFTTIDQPGVGRVLAPGIPLEFSAFARAPAKPAPRLGEDTEQVLNELLGLDAAAYGRLHDKGLVAGPA